MEIIEEVTKCSKCNTDLNSEDKFCSECGYPERGTIDEKNNYNYRIQLKKNVIKDANKKIKNVKIMLLIIAGINLLLGLFYLTDSFMFADGITSIIASGLFVGCVIWVNKQPLSGVLAAFIFWIILQLSVVLYDPSLLFSGLLLKIVFIVIFIKGISSAKDAQEFTKQLKDIKAL